MKNQLHIWDKLYIKRLFWKKETINLPKLFKGKSVLELGVGTGKTLKSILKQNPERVVAVDFSEKAINIAKDRIKDPRVKFVCSDIFDFQPAEKFDVMICYYVLNNLSKEERIKAIEKIRNLLKEEGIILFEDFAKGDFREKAKRQDGLLCHFFSEAEIRDLFRCFSAVKISTRSSQPIRADKKLERRIISAIVKRPR